MENTSPTKTPNAVSRFLAIVSGKDSRAHASAPGDQGSWSASTPIFVVLSVLLHFGALVLAVMLIGRDLETATMVSIVPAVAIGLIDFRFQSLHEYHVALRLARTWRPDLRRELRGSVTASAMRLGVALVFGLVLGTFLMMSVLHNDIRVAVEAECPSSEFLGQLAA